MGQLKLLCTDLDRTLLPNGDAAESPGVRTQLAELLRQQGIQLAYVTGRDQQLVRQAIAEYALPAPDFVIADVGSTLYRCHDDHWQAMPDWRKKIGQDWQFAEPARLLELMADLDLRLQEPAKQGRYKLSFYTALDFPCSGLLVQIQQRFTTAGIKVHLIYSVDDAEGVGLLDVLPAAAGKRPAIEFLLESLNLHCDQMLFAGDSGNDLDVLCSPLPAVLVANADAEVIAHAREQAAAQGTFDQLYVATGLVGNGCYAAGILEGIFHYYPAQESRPCSR